MPRVYSGLDKQANRATYGQGNDIGAIGAGMTNASDRFGLWRMFGPDSVSAPDTPVIPCRTNIKNAGLWSAAVQIRDSVSLAGADVCCASKPGRTLVTESPPSARFSILIVPPWASTISRQRANPRPDPRSLVE
jgi:hypothetical protein